MALWFAVRKEAQLRDIVGDHQDCEDEQENEGGLINALLEVLIQIAAHHAFNQQEENYSAIEDGNRQQVEYSQVDADEGHDLEERGPARHGGCLADLLTDANRAAESA